MPSPETTPDCPADPRFSGLFGQMLVGVAQVDLSGRFVKANDRYLEIVGRTATALRALRMQDITHPDDLAENLAAFVPLVEGQGGPFIVEKRYLRPDGTVVWVNNSVSPVMGPSGRPEGVITVTIDVTERRRAEDELRRVNAELKQEGAQRASVIRRLSEALSLAEEEERRRVAQLLHDELQPTLVGAQIAAVQGDLVRLERVLDQALQTTRTLSHSLSPPTGKGPAVRPLLEWLAVRKRELHRLDVTLVVGPRVAIEREDLRVLLYHVLRELLLNVVKHSGGTRAMVQAETRLGPEGPMVRVVVSDDGAGFDPSVLRQPPASCGLGLCSVRERLEIVGGRFGVESAPGTGTRLTVEVPAYA